MSADFTKLPAFGPGGRVNIVIESPKAARIKLKYEPALGAFAYTRSLPEGVSYPFDWGFIPSTRGADGDPVDAMVVHDSATYPGTIIPCRPLGVLQVRQTEKGKIRRNDRLMFQPIGDPSEDDIHDVADLPMRTKKQLEQFFAALTLGTDKRVKFLGWRGAEYARRAIRAGAAAYTRSQREKETGTRGAR